MHLSTAETGKHLNSSSDRDMTLDPEFKFSDERTKDEDTNSSREKENKIDQPVISVIMPVYNMAPYIKSSISSVLRQTFSSFELILVDDASTDESRRICERVCKKDPRIRLIDCPDHRGVSHARNLGIEAAKGKYICFQDSDDRMHPQMLECMWQEAEKIQADLIMTDHWNSNILSPKAWKRLCARPAASEWEIWTGLKVWETFCHQGLGGIVWAKLFLRESIGNLRFCEEINRSEDWLFNYQFLKLKSQMIAVTNFKSCYHLKRMNSLTHHSTFDEFMASMKINQYIRDQELKAGREENALCIEQEIVACIRREWIYTNPKKASADRSRLLKVLYDKKGKSPLFEELSAYQKFLLFLSIRAMPVYRGLTSGKDHIRRFKNSFFSKT